MKQVVIGADEVGTGCIAGPAVVCAVCVPVDWRPPPGLNDSKKLTALQRGKLEDALRADPDVNYKFSIKTNGSIDKLGIRVVVIAAFRQTISALKICHLNLGDEVTDVIVDGDMRLEFARSVVKADATVPAVMAASVLAKTYRDTLMRVYDEEHPGYDFTTNKGYGTKQHLEVLREKGPCKLHRRSFEPVKTMLQKGILR